MSVIDFRHTRWGHNFYLTNKGGGRFSGLLICTPGPKVGDTLIWKTAYGYAEARVEKSVPKMDPVDMYTVDANIICRIADPTIVSQDELDQYFSGEDSTDK